MKDIKILHIVGGSEFGGIAPYIMSLIRMVQEYGWDAKVLVSAPRVIDYFHSRGIDVVNLPGIDRPVNIARDLSGLFRLICYLNRNEYQIVHTHTSKGGIIGRLAAWLTNVPVIIHTTQGYAFRDYAQNGFQRWFFLWLEKIATQCCDLIISANQEDRQLAIELGIAYESKIVHIPNGIDLTEIDASPMPSDIYATLGAQSGRKIVGTMARLAPQKGIEFFLEAASEVIRVDPTVQFIVVGEGPQRADLEALSKQMGINVMFVGFRSDWIQVLRVMDVFVMPSLWEGLPMTLLGAMATSRPIVATRIKGITDACGNHKVARLVEPKDSHAIAQGIIGFLQDDSMSMTYGFAARKRVEEEYSESVINAKIWQLYASLLKKNMP
jgi:glycosyltransferase involved in cell wall biosynthesis